MDSVIGQCFVVHRELVTPGASTFIAHEPLHADAERIVFPSANSFPTLEVALLIFLFLNDEKR
jgi:hypothetical protein